MSAPKQCMVIGDPVAHSLSPAMHNAGYKALRLDDDFVFSASRVKAEDLASFVKSIRTSGIRGVSCTTPHKIAIMQHLDVIDPVAQKIGAVNTVVNDDGVLSGYNTDWLGVVKPLERLTNLRAKRVALLGAGGAARAAVYGLVERGAEVTIYNRTLEKAESLAKEFGAEARSLEAVGELSGADVIVNTTSADSGTLVPKTAICSEQIVFDIVYKPERTKLLEDAHEQGAQTVDGLEMLLLQGTAQFELYTGRDAPEETMRNALKGRQ